MLSIPLPADYCCIRLTALYPGQPAKSCRKVAIRQIGKQRRKHILLGEGNNENCFWRPFVKRFALLSDGCLSCLSVTLAYCGQTVGWIRMPLGMERGLDRSRPHCVRWGPPKSRGHIPQISAHVDLLWPNGWMDQDAT